MKARIKFLNGIWWKLEDTYWSPVRAWDYKDHGIDSKKKSSTKKKKK